jgi:hypothetical protein
MTGYTRGNGPHPQLQRSATQQRDRFCFAFAQIARRELAISLQPFRGMSEQHVRQFMEPRLVRHRIDRIDRNRSTSGESQHVPVCLVEGSFDNVQHGQCTRRVLSTESGATGNLDDLGSCASTNQCGRR